MERYYKIAGIRLRVEGPDEEMYTDDGILTQYRTEEGFSDHTLSFRLVDTYAQLEGQLIFSDPTVRVYAEKKAVVSYIGTVSKSLEDAYMHIRRESDFSMVQVKRSDFWTRISPKTVLKAMEMAHQLAVHDAVLFHSAFIRYRDRAILFTAPSGIGKSTQAQLWCDYLGAELINGDRAAIQLSSHGVTACGVPFSGSSDVRKNVTLPLAAVVYLSQAPENRIERLAGVKAFRRIWEGCTVQVWEHQDMEHCSDVIMQAAARVPVFHLACTPDRSAVEVLLRALEKECNL